jgi:erythromycin esterase
MTSFRARLLWAVLLASFGAAAAGIAQEAPAASSQDVPAPQAPFLNLDFEFATPYGMPLNWYIEAEEAGAGVRVRLDDTNAFPGGKALRVTADGKAPFPIYTPLFLDQTCRQEVVLKGSARAERAGIVIRPILFAPGGNRTMGPPLNLRGEGWEEFRHRMTANPGECLPPSLKIGLLVMGPGEVWIDRLDLSVDGSAWGGTAPREQESEAEFRALAAASVGLEDYSAVAGLTARTRAAALFRSARVIALGENSHGASALFRMKLDLVRFLVSEQDYRVFALEMPATEADKVNDYVLRRSSDRDLALKALNYPSWQTEEMWRVVEWLRQYNRDARNPVQFRGFDVQNPQLPLAAAARLVGAVRDPAVAQALTALRQAMAADSTAKAALTEIEKLSSQVEVSTAIPLSDKPTLLRYLRTLARSLKVGKPELNGKTRDAYMADEVMDLLAQIGPEEKIILWADNTHVTRADHAMGYYLSNRLRESYLAVGFTFNSGRYSAYGPERHYSVQEGFAGTHEYILSRGRQGDYLVAPGSLPASHALRRPAGFRYIGSRPQRLNQFHPLRLEDHFDVVGYVETTEGTHDLVTHVFE